MVNSPDKNEPGTPPAHQGSKVKLLLDYSLTVSTLVELQQICIKLHEHGLTLR